MKTQNSNIALLANYIYKNVGYYNSKNDIGDIIKVRKTYADLYDLRSELMRLKDAKKKVFNNIDLDFAIKYVNKNISMTKARKPIKIQQENFNGKTDLITVNKNKIKIDFAN